MATDTSDQPGRVIVITGAMAAGKSTVAEMLAARLPKSVHVRGDMFRRMIVNGREEMTPDPSDAASRQLTMRYRLATATADQFAAEGFDAVLQDVIVGPMLPRVIELIRTAHRHLVVLSPSLNVLELRERQRAKEGYGHFTAAEMDEILRRNTERVGYWLDSSAQSPEETVDDILAHLDEARV